MEGYDPAAAFGDGVAAGYDDLARRGDEGTAAVFLADVAGDGAALELAIGTGRIALPLAARGVRVDGIDLSEAMVARLRAKPGGEALTVTIGDFADVDVTGRYRLIYVVANTFFNLVSQEDQVRCFANVAAHLTDDGAFVVEGGTPAVFYRLRNEQYVDAEAVGVDEVRLDVARFDPVSQVLQESHVSLSEAGVRLTPVVTRYAWPSEMDLMARLAGLRLAERWGGWGREPFTAHHALAPSGAVHGTTCVSVYRRP